MRRFLPAKEGPYLADELAGKLLGLVRNGEDVRVTPLFGRGRFAFVLIRETRASKRQRLES